jgi:hypothetical protein
MTQDVHLDQAIARVAVRQYGIITRTQLLALGLWDAAISYRVKSGRLHRVHTGVYAVGIPATKPLQRAAAAVLACGPTAALSHESAMVLWGLWRRWPRTMEVSVTSRRSPTGITVHHPTTLAPRDIKTQEGIRVTSPARTLLDIARRLTPKSLTRAVNNALSSPWLTEAQLAELIQRNPTHPSTRLLAPFVDDHQGLTRSELEDAFKEFCAAYGLPMPKLNHMLNGYIVDAYFETEQLIVELDSWTFHSSRRAFETDRTRDADALTRGIPTVRITHERLSNRPDHEAERLTRILEARRRVP